MRQVSAFIIELAKSISTDLRDSVAPDKLQFEVERELEKQIMAQLVHAIHEYNGAREPYGKQEAVPIKRRQVLRYMGYCSEMWTSIDFVKGALGTGKVGEEIDSDFEVVGADA